MLTEHQHLRVIKFDAGNELNFGWAREVLRPEGPYRKPDPG